MSNQPGTVELFSATLSPYTKFEKQLRRSGDIGDISSLSSQNHQTNLLPRELQDSSNNDGIGSTKPT